MHMNGPVVGPVVWPPQAMQKAGLELSPLREHKKEPGRLKLQDDAGLGSIHSRCTS